MMAGHTSQQDLLFNQLHELSQPLTVMGMALTLAQTAANEDERALALDTAMHECNRAMRSVRQMRQVLEQQPETELPTLGAGAAPSRRDLWPFGGTA